MDNVLPILIVIYGDDKDLNVSIARDELNLEPVRQEMRDREIDIEFVRKDGASFNAKLYDYNGTVVFETNKWDKDTFKEISRVIDNLPAKEPKGINDTLESETLSLTLPSDSYDTEIQEVEEEIEDLDDNQERDTDLIGVEYPEDGFSKNAYIQMKNKYLALKTKFINQFN